jgi:hypothetical protein
MEETKLLSKLEKIRYSTAYQVLQPHADAGSCLQIFGTTLVKINVIIIVESTTVAILNQIETRSSKTKLLCNFAIWIGKFHIII